MYRPTCRLLAFVALTLAQFAGLAAADAPLRTDNADVPDQGNCKLETGYAGSAPSPAFFAGASCVPYGVVELSAAYSRSRESDGPWGNGYGLQAKVPIVAKDDDDDWYAIATELAVGREAGATGGGFQSAWLNVPVSFYLLHDRLRLHLNAGGLWQHARPDVLTWGAAAEYETGRVTWLAETYRIEAGKARYSAGARYELSDGFALYVSASRSFGNDPGSWLVTAGIKLESPTFLASPGVRSGAANRVNVAGARDISSGGRESAR